jgi:CheY-like chemotaxis protein
MADSGRQYVVVAFSPQPSLAYFMKGVLDCAGLTAIAASSNPEEIEALAQRARPDAVVYDVSFPFVENWDRLQELRTRPALSDIPFVITTSEAQELERRVGVSTAIELFSRPKDVQEFQSAVRSAIETGARGHAA